MDTIVALLYRANASAGIRDWDSVITYLERIKVQCDQSIEIAKLAKEDPADLLDESGISDRVKIQVVGPDGAVKQTVDCRG